MQRLLSALHGRDHRPPATRALHADLLVRALQSRRRLLRAAGAHDPWTQTLERLRAG